jgi:hypothetical protein
MKPARADQWGADRFTVRRNLELRDPSMMARGLSANMTGSRADIIICDDVEVPNTCDTAEKRADLRERLGEAEFVLVPGGTMLYIGTPHAWHSIYADVPRAETGEARPFLDGFRRLTIPVINKDGASAWPERFTSDDIARMRVAAGPNKFASQMMLAPVNIAEGRLDPAALQFYADRLHFSRELQMLYLGENRVVSCSAWWDPAFGRSGDSSVLAVIFTTEDGRRHLHRVEYITIDSADNGSEAEQQCRKVSFIAQLLFVPCVTVETNGIGKFLPTMLKKELAKNKVRCGVAEATSSRAKDLRILEAFDAPLAAQSLYAHESVRETPLLLEMREWRPGMRSQRDDGLDAVAGALSLSPVRLPFEAFNGRQSWHGGGKQHSAKTEFEV